MIIQGDCIEVMAGMPENSVDAVVTDPPYGLEFMGKEWDSFKMHSPQGAYEKVKGFHQLPRLSASQPIPYQSWTTQWATQALRVLKPGGYLLAFGGTRTYHRLVCGLEDAGFEIRDTICWLYGSGFPKSLDISKQIDKMAGAEREVIGQKVRGNVQQAKTTGSTYAVAEANRNNEAIFGYGVENITVPATEAAKEWQGWGTALKPAWESIVIAQKPLTIEGEQDIITVNLIRLEAQLWSLLPANVAGLNFKLSQNEYAEVCDFAQWNAEGKSNTQAGLLAQMDISQFVSVIGTSLSIVQSWRSIWADILKAGNMYTTETESSQIIDSKTLNSLLLQTTPETLIQAVTSVGGKRPNALPVEIYLVAVVEKLNSTLTLSALEAATSRDESSNLRPNFEPIVVARKPLSEKNVASNVLRWSTGGIDIDGARINHDEPLKETHRTADKFSRTHAGGRGWRGKPEEQRVASPNPQGRWPANVILDEEAAAMLDEQSGESKSSGGNIGVKGNKVYGKYGEPRKGNPGFGDTGGASRFFYVAKASSKERGKGNNHPTCKPIKLMEYLIKLVSREGATILDQFAGSGSTLLAAEALGRKCIGIEQSGEYCEIARSRCGQMVLT